MSGSLEPPFESRDPSGMGRLIESAPEQAAAALRATESWPRPAASPELLAVGAMGGSAIAADLSAAVFRDRLPRPLLVVRDYRFPASVTPRSLALIASYSGNTEETLSLLEDARARGVPWWGMATGGRLAEACARDGAPCRTLPGGMPPRAALYASWVTITQALGALGWIDGVERDWREAAVALAEGVAAWGLGRPEANNEAKWMARALDSRYAFIYAEQRLEPVATRWRNQLNENAKLLGHSCVVPELNHNEVVGWERMDVPATQISVVLLRDGLEAEPNRVRLELTAEYLRGLGVPVLEPPLPGGGALARAASLVLLGDFVSYYLAMRRGVDPTPIRSLDEFKQRLSEWRTSRAGGAT